MLDLLNAFVVGFYQVFAWQTFSLMLVGIGVGFIVGIMPGLGGPTTLALMLPFIFSMTPVEAFAFLLGMSAVTATTGDITSVLFGVPGEATSAATVVDGHPMARKGEAGRALGAALMSSLVGAVFGAFALALAIPIVRPLVLSFGSPEMFMLGVLGMTFIAALSSDDLLKGLVAGGFGFFLATVGMDKISGIQRYTFDQLFLWDGIGLVPVAVGLFAIPEIIELAVTGGAIAHHSTGKIGGVLQGVKDTFRHFWLVIRCSAIGAYIGLIPGLGGSVAQWVSYAHAVQSSPDKERFGKGAVEGVLGPGAANNSILGSTLIPTIAFGVPTSLTTAILLGAFLVQGIVPGPDMLRPEPAGKLSLTFSFVWIIVVSNVIAVALCFIFVKQLVRLTSIRSTLLMPFILLMVFLGAYAERNALEDVGVLLVFGAIGWVMVKYNWQRPPLLLGLVLGPIMENRLFLSTDNYGLAWLWRPGVLIIAAIAVVGMLYPVMEKKLKARGAPQTPKNPHVKRPIDRANAIITGCLIALLTIALWQSQNFGYRAGLFPWVVGFPLLAISFLLLGLILTGREYQSPVTEAALGGNYPETSVRPLPQSEATRRALGISGWIAAYLLAIVLFGFPIAVFLMTVLYLRFSGLEKWSVAVIVACVTWVCFYGLFHYILGMPFPGGLIFELLV
jgi:putative tricarboxylic transport membrane protein